LLNTRIASSYIKALESVLKIWVFEILSDLRMRINADVSITNRSLCPHNMRNRAKQVRSSLAIGKKDIKTATKETKEIFLMLCTAKNMGGTKYQLTGGNVRNVFTKFVAEGKATIRFGAPEHDLCVNTKDVIQLKAFLSVLHKVLKDGDVSDLTLSAMAPASARQVAKPKTKMTITEKKDYPITSGFPGSLEILTAVGLNLKKFDSRLLKLRHLTTLNLSDNVIPEIPEGISELKKLTELKMSGNGIVILKRSFFESLSKTLRLLDLSKNSLKSIPNNITRLSSLRTLKLDNNDLERLPFPLGNIASLEELTVSCNRLAALPGSLAVGGRQQLELLDLADNPLKSAEDSGKILFDNLAFPSLFDLVLGACLRYGIRPTAEQAPAAMIARLDSGMECRCGKMCFSAKAVVLASMSLSRLARTFLCDGGSDVLLEAVMCSKKCSEKYSKNPFAF
jgi:LRR-repeat protein 1